MIQDTLEAIMDASNIVWYKGLNKAWIAETGNCFYTLSQTDTFFTLNFVRTGEEQDHNAHCKRAQGIVDFIKRMES